MTTTNTARCKISDLLHLYRMAKEKVDQTYVEMMVRMLQDLAMWKDRVKDVTVYFIKAGGLANGACLIGLDANNVDWWYRLSLTIPGDMLRDVENHMISLAHELGHLYRRMSMPHEERLQYTMANILAIEVLKAADSLESIGLEQPDYEGAKFAWEHIMVEEMAAWWHARVILRDLGYTNWSRFELERKGALKTYEPKWLKG